MGTARPRLGLARCGSRPEPRDELDQEARAGRWRGPLHGVPLGIKDIIDMAGLPTGAGSRRMAATAATSDATLVRELRNAGAILLGKTVTTQFACFDPPPTRNPWNVERTPGGSSSGSAAAVAAGMCCGAIGSQTGGSITRPAAYCGVAGCKPSYGRVSLAGIVPFGAEFRFPRTDRPVRRRSGPAGRRDCRSRSGRSAFGDRGLHAAWLVFRTISIGEASKARANSRFFPGACGCRDARCV